MRKGDFTDAILDLWESQLLRSITTRDIDEQPALAYMMTEYEFVRERTVFVVCELINALMQKYEQGKHHLIYHLAGCSNDECVNNWKKAQGMKKQNEEAYYRSLRG